MKKITIAIDGYSSCGKSTMAKDLAREIGYIYIDSGAMYRAVTLYSLQKGFFSEKGIDTEALKTAMPDIHISFRLNPETQRPMTFLNDTNVEDAIRSMEVSSHVSPIAALGFVREALVKQQQQMGKAKGIVMDGRDIGTVVFPDAELIGRLGCGSVINLPVILAGEMVATVNMLHEEGYYTPERVAMTHELLTLPAMAAMAVAARFSSSGPAG